MSAINNKFSRIVFGRGSSEIKQRYGCTLTHLYLALKTDTKQLITPFTEWMDKLKTISLKRFPQYKKKETKT